MNNTIFIPVSLDEFNLYSLKGTVKDYIHDVIMGVYEVDLSNDKFIIKNATPIITVSEQEITPNGRKGNIHIRDTLMVTVQLT